MAVKGRLFKVRLRTADQKIGVKILRSCLPHRKCYCLQWWYLFLDLSAAKLYLRERNQMIENGVQMSVFNLLTNSISVNGQVYDIANRHAGFHKHFICKETLSCGDSPTGNQTLIESSTQPVLILQNYVGVIEKQVPPIAQAMPTTLTRALFPMGIYKFNPIPL